MTMRNTFCPLPWTQLNFKSGKRIYPCCRIYKFDNHATFETIDDYLNSEELYSLRKNLLDGVKDNTCQKC